LVLTKLIDETALLTPDEVADALSTTRAHVYLLVKRAELPAVKIGKLIRVPAGAVRRLVAGAEVRR
jgi:excisionase family DNA binding protein